jgi:DNA-binding SARP family transcriptional activator/transcriptional regulator with XRE-family HTH domain
MDVREGQARAISGPAWASWSGRPGDRQEAGSEGGVSGGAAGGEAFGTLLRGHRAVAGLTQEDLAKLAGLSVRAVANWERGRARPRRRSVALLADALALSIRQRKLFTQAARPELAAGSAAMPQLAMAEPGTGSQPAPEVPFQLPAAPRHVVKPAAELDQLSMWVRVLGPVQVRDGDGWVGPAGPQLRLLLARLALSAGRVVPVDELMDVLWAQRPPPSARASLQILVVGLRKALAGLPGCALERYGDGYQLRAAADMVDVHRFRSLVSSARQAPDEHQAIAAFDQALALWRGPALSDVPATPGVEAMRAGLAEEHLSAIQDRFACLVAAGRNQEAAAGIALVLAGHPLAERLAGMLMIAWYRCGRQADALRVFRDLRGRLASELALEPGPELQRLHQQILSGDPALAASGSLAGLLRGGQAPAPVNPAGTDAQICPVRPAQRADAPEWPGSGKQEAEGPGSRELGVEAGPGLYQRVGARDPGPESLPGSGNARRADAGNMSAAMVPRQLPAAPAHFVGRQRELGLLIGWLDAGTAAGQTVIFAIGGSAGVGKTALALHWAHRVQHRFPDGQLYMNLRGYSPCGDPISTYSAIRAFLEALQVSPDRIPADPEAQAGLYRSLLAGRRTLILLDNARDADHVRALLPGSGGCLVVVTSRGRLAGLAATEGAHPIWLDVLNHEDARSLLVRRLGADRIGTGGLVDELIELCARLPLALSVTAARIAEHPDFPLSSIVEQLRDEQHRLDALDTGEPASGVRSVLSRSYEQLSDSAARMFRLLGLHPGPDVTVPAAASLAAVSHVSARHAIDELTRCSLLAEHSPGRFACHDLLRNYAAELTSVQDKEADRQAALRRVLDHYLQCSVALSQSLDPTREQIRVLPPAAKAVAEPIVAPADAHAWFEAEHHVLTAAIAKAARGGFDVHA